MNFRVELEEVREGETSASPLTHDKRGCNGCLYTQLLQLEFLTRSTQRAHPGDSGTSTRAAYKIKHSPGGDIRAWLCTPRFSRASTRHTTRHARGKHLHVRVLAVKLPFLCVCAHLRFPLLFVKILFM